LGWGARVRVWLTRVGEARGDLEGEDERGERMRGEWGSTDRVGPGSSPPACVTCAPGWFGGLLVSFVSRVGGNGIAEDA
jgi:hypothetical protein